MKFVPVQVEAYAGYKAAERPLAFTQDGRRYQVDQILDRWFEGGRHPRDQKIDYFKVRTACGRVAILRRLTLFDSWSVLDRPAAQPINADAH